MDLVKVFRVSIPVELRRGRGSRVVLYPDGERAVIEYAYEDELIESFAYLRLGLDYSPLLATLWFQEELSKEEEGYASMFYTLIAPLWMAWAWKNAKRYLPGDVFEKEIRSLYEESQMFLMWEGRERVSEALYRKITLGMYLTALALGKPAQLVVEGRKDEVWDRYVKTLEEFVRKEPSPHLLAKLPEITKAPYRVEVKEKPYLHYEVRGV